jgi:hypothetical protein
MDNNLKLLLVGGGCLLVGIVIGINLAGGSASAPSAVVPSAQPPSLEDLEKAVGDNPTAAAAASAAPPAAPEAPTSDWRVVERTDAMTDATIKTACTTSSNQVHLDAPYGSRSAQLCIRQHPEFGRDVYLSLNGSGQILCHSYSDCTIPVRFDDGAVQRFTGNEPSDNSSETVFFANDGRFITAARSASRIRVQLEFYQNGSQTFDFPAKGLVW